MYRGLYGCFSVKGSDLDSRQRFRPVLQIAQPTLNIFAVVKASVVAGMMEEAACCPSRWLLGECLVWVLPACYYHLS
jgi:hypothetical protein